MGFSQVPRGSSAFGYNIGTQYYRGSGSGIGQNIGGIGVFAQGQGSTVNGNDTTTWTPDIGYLFVLIIVEMAIFAWLSRRV